MRLTKRLLDGLDNQTRSPSPKHKLTKVPFKVSSSDEEEEGIKGCVCPKNKQGRKYKCLFPECKKGARQFYCCKVCENAHWQSATNLAEVKLLTAQRRPAKGEEVKNQK